MNPTVDEVITILVNEMIEGAKPFEVTDMAKPVFDEWFRDAFTERLKIAGIWAKEGSAVRNAARQVGVVAGAIARLQQLAEIRRFMVEKATTLVQEHCVVGVQEGQWCSRRPE